MLLIPFYFLSQLKEMGDRLVTEFRAVSVFTVKKAKHVALAQQLCVFWYILLGRA